MDYDPGTLAELDPMARAILRHIFARKGKVIALSFVPTGTLLAKQALLRRRRGVQGPGDPGGRPLRLPWLQPALRRGDPVDRAEHPRQLPHGLPRRAPRRHGPLQGRAELRRHPDRDRPRPAPRCAAGWIGNAVERFGARFAMGVTNVMAADMTPVHPRPVQGHDRPGMRGAAEYEALLEKHYGITKGADAIRGMGSQSVTHFFMPAPDRAGQPRVLPRARKKGGAR